MKKKLGIILAVILTVALLTSTVAFAADGSKIDNAIGKVQQRLDFLNKVKPFIDQISANKTQIQSLRLQLKGERQQAMAHIADLKKNISSLTDDQLQALQTITAQIKDARTALVGTNAQMVQAKQSLRTARRNKDYDGTLAAYNTVITIQQTRVTQLNKLIDLNKQIQSI